MSLSCRNNETSKRIAFFEHSHASSDVPKFKKQIITVILKEYLKLDNTKCLKLGESYFLQIHGTKMGIAKLVLVQWHKKRRIFTSMHCTVRCFLRDVSLDGQYTCLNCRYHSKLRRKSLSWFLVKTKTPSSGKVNSCSTTKALNAFSILYDHVKK